MSCQWNGNLGIENVKLKNVQQQFCCASEITLLLSSYIHFQSTVNFEPIESIYKYDALYAKTI